MTDEQAQQMISALAQTSEELQIIRKMIYTYGLGEDSSSGPCPGVLAGIKNEIHGVRELLEDRMTDEERRFLMLSLSAVATHLSRLDGKIRACEQVLKKHPEVSAEYQKALSGIGEETLSVLSETISKLQQGLDRGQTP
jgi:hypothetical protein